MHNVHKMYTTESYMCELNEWRVGGGSGRSRQISGRGCGTVALEVASKKLKLESCISGCFRVSQTPPAG